MSKEYLFPQQPLTQQYAVSVNESAFLPEEQLRIWARELDAMGPVNQPGLRATASAEQEAYIDELIDQLKAAGVTEIHEEPIEVERWIAESWSLHLNLDGQQQEVRTASYIPFTGCTDEKGVTAPLALMKTGKESLAGKIAVTKVSFLGVPEGLFNLLACKEMSNDPQHEMRTFHLWKRSTMGGAGKIKDAILSAEKCGAVGLIIVLDYPYDGAYGTYVNALDGIIRNVPGIYLDREAGSSVLQAAKLGQTATIVLKAVREKAITRNVFGIIPGKRKDSFVVVNSHTDGLNAVEENGTLALVSIAQYLTRLPEDSLEHSVMILLTTGHFLTSIGAQEFCRMHKADYLKQCAAVIALEHIGAIEWDENKQGHMAPTGRYEPALFFVPDRAGFNEGAKHMMEVAGTHPVKVCRPIPIQKLGFLKKKLPELPGDDMDGMLPGEGQLFAINGVPTANYISGPVYTGNWGVEAHKRIDYPALRRTILGFTQMILDLCQVSKFQKNG